MNRKSLSWGIALSLGVFSLSVITGVAILAWTEPAAAPTGGNISAPINTSGNTQTKSGGLNIMGKLGIGNNSPTAQLDVTGDAKATRFCLNNVCCTKWEDCLTATPTPPGGCTNPASCSGTNPCCGGYVCDSGTKECIVAGGGCTSNADCAGDLVCLSTGACGKYPCSYSKPGAKRIFVTSTPILGSEFDVALKTKDKVADEFCQAQAETAKLPNAKKYLALVNFGVRDPKSVLPLGMAFWNGVSSNDTSKCIENEVSKSGTELFNTTGIKAPILGDERGVALNNVFVWTNFRPAGPSSTTPLSAGAFVWPKLITAGDGTMYTPPAYCAVTLATGVTGTWSSVSFFNSNQWIAGTGYACFKTSQWFAVGHWYGNTSETSEKWAYNTFAAMGINANRASSRALYCVEQ